jgi:hypothetical protein
MGKTLAKLNVAFLEGTCPTVNDQMVNWHAIEQAYGKKIPSAARNEILKATNKFLEFAAFAQAARPVTEVSRHLDALKAFRW